MPTRQIQKHLSANMNMSKRQIMLANFLGGLAWGLGTVIGATVVVAALGAVLNWLGVFEAFKQLQSVPKFI